MLFGYIIFVGLPRKCTIPIISFLNNISIHFGSSYMPVRTRMFSNRKKGWCEASRFGRSGSSGSSGFAGGFHRLRLSNCGLSPKGRSCRDRCRYRYICRPKRIQFPPRGRLKLLRFLGELGIEFVTVGEFTLCAFDFGNDFVVEADLVQVSAAVIQIVDLSAVGQDGGGTVAVEVVVVANGFGNGQVQHVVLRIVPVAFG